MWGMHDLREWYDKNGINYDKVMSKVKDVIIEPVHQRVATPFVHAVAITAVAAVAVVDAPSPSPVPCSHRRRRYSAAGCCKFDQVFGNRRWD